MVGDACSHAIRRLTSSRDMSGKENVANSALAAADTRLSMAMTANSAAEQFAAAARQRQWQGVPAAHKQPSRLPASCSRASAIDSGEESRCWRYFSALATAGAPGASSVKKLPKRPSDSGAYMLFLPTYTSYSSLFTREMRWDVRASKRFHIASGPRAPLQPVRPARGDLEAETARAPPSLLVSRWAVEAQASLVHPLSANVEGSAVATAAARAPPTAAARTGRCKSRQR
eukprot:1043424-Pleurochrysis_carterae.AAC.3